MGRKHATSHQRFKPRFDRRRLQRGAVAIWVGVSIVAFIMATFIAIDVGRLYFTQRNLQKTATLAAVSAAQIASGCTAGDGIRVGADDLFNRVQAIVVANGGSANWLTGINGTPAIEVGRIKTRSADGVRVFVPLNEDDPLVDSVRVNLSQPAPASFISSFVSGSGATLRASSTARQAVLGSIGVGSGLLSLDSSNITFLNFLLPPLLSATGINLNLNALDYQGLARTNVSIGMLATAVGVDVQDLSSLLDTSTTLPGVLNGLSPLVNQVIVGGTSGTVTGLLNQLGSAAAGNTTPIPLVNVLGNTVQAVGAAVPAINLLDLVIALGMATHADSSGAITPIMLPVSLSSLAGIDLRVYLQILEPPRVSMLGAPGSTSASTAQIRLLVRLQVTTVSDIVDGLNGLLDFLNALLGLLGTSLGTFDIDPIKLGIDLNVDPATAYLDEIGCPVPSINGGFPVARTSASTGVASVQIGSFNGNIGTVQSTTLAAVAPITGVHLGPVRVLGAPLGSLSLNVNAVRQSPIVVGNPALRPLNDVVDFTRLTDLPPGTARAWIADGLPPDASVAANPQTISSTNLLESALDSTLHTLAAGITVTRDPSTSQDLLDALSSILSALVNSVTTTLVNTLEPLLVDVVGSLLDSIIEPLLASLGIEVGSATRFMRAVAIDTPATVTNCLPNSTGPRACLPAE